MKGVVSGTVNVGEEGKGGEAGRRRLDCRWTEENESGHKAEMQDSVNVEEQRTGAARDMWKLILLLTVLYQTCRCLDGRWVRGVFAGDKGFVGGERRCAFPEEEDSERDKRSKWRTEQSKGQGAENGGWKKRHGWDNKSCCSTP